MFGNKGDDGYILAIGRITASKRQHLLVHAMSHVGPNVRLVIAGQPERPDEGEEMERLVADRGLQDRVRLDLRFISDEEKVELLARARAVAYLPHDEDSYGYVTVEAMLSHKPVITAKDSGGVLQLVRHQHTGLVAEATPESLAAAMQSLSSDARLATRMGQAGNALVEKLDLSWDSVVETLLS
jgi:glycosyltransferase involved in cell wall biosynthesis